METFLIKPKKGLIIRDPGTALPLPANGAIKPKNSFWLRRLAEQSIDVIEQKVPEPGPEPEKNPEKGGKKI